MLKDSTAHGAATGTARYTSVETMCFNRRGRGNGRNKIVVTRCHVFIAELRWESRRLANPRRQSTARDCRLSDENRANKEIDII